MCQARAGRFGGGGGGLRLGGGGNRGGGGFFGGSSNRGVKRIFMLEFNKVLYGVIMHVDPAR